MTVKENGHQLKICEIFTSIQGESSFAGIPCIFIRLTGCNLRCTYCDTQYAYYEGKEISEDEIIRQVRCAGMNLTEITGGEPLLQRDVYSLIKKLIEEGHTVLIETNGSQNIKDIDKNAVVILDVKTPGSGMHEKMDMSNLDLLKKNDEVKFVLTSRSDYEWSKEIIHRHKLTDRCGLLLSPAFGILPVENLIQWMIKDKLQVRLNLQMHKYIFGSDRRGV